MKTAIVSFKPSALGYSDWLHLGAAIRYPRSSRPLTAWIIRESLFIALFGGSLCAFAAFVANPMTSPIRPALRGILLLLSAWAMYYFAIRPWWAYRAYRAANVLVVEFSDDGVLFQYPDSEWRLRWKPEIKIEVANRFVVISYGKKALVGIPRESFASREAEDEFVRVGRLYQAAATGKATHEMKGAALEEV